MRWVARRQKDEAAGPKPTPGTTVVMALGSVLLVVIIALTDRATGTSISFGLFYLAPVSLAAVRLGWGAASLFAVAGAAAGLWADLTNCGPLSWGVPSAGPIALWNAVMRLFTLLIVAHLLSRLARALDEEKRLSRTDPLTGAANWRQLSEVASAEILRAARYGHPFTVIYMDVDDFKQVNDQRGHLAGDALLALVARTLRENLRALDTIARLGGDEFAILLPETDADSAQVLLARLAECLRAAAPRSPSPVTFSIGAVTFLTPPDSADAMLAAADRLMYEVKRSGKNGLRHVVQGAVPAVP